MASHYVYRNGMAVAVEEAYPDQPVQVLVESIGTHISPNDFGIRMDIAVRVMPEDAEKLSEAMRSARATHGGFLLRMRL